MLVKVQSTNIGKRTYDYGKIHTVKEVVHFLKISKQTAQRVINTAAIKPDKRDNNQCRFYSYRKMMKIVKLSNPGFERRNVTQQTETSRQTSEIILFNQWLALKASNSALITHLQRQIPK